MNGNTGCVFTWSNLRCAGITCDGKYGTFRTLPGVIVQTCP